MNQQIPPSRPEWATFHLGNVIYLRKYKPEPNTVPPATYDMNMGLLYGSIRFVYSRTLMTAKYVRHVYQALSR